MCLYMWSGPFVINLLSFPCPNFSFYNKKLYFVFQSLQHPRVACSCGKSERDGTSQQYDLYLFPWTWEAQKAKL